MVILYFPNDELFNLKRRIKANLHEFIFEILGESAKPIYELKRIDWSESYILKRRIKANLHEFILEI